MKEKSSGRDRNEKVKIAQSNNSIYGGLSFSAMTTNQELLFTWSADIQQEPAQPSSQPASSSMWPFIFLGHANS